MDVCKRRKDYRIIEHSTKENESRIEYDHKVGDAILIINLSEKRSKERKMNEATEMQQCFLGSRD